MKRNALGDGGGRHDEENSQLAIPEENPLATEAKRPHDISPRQVGSSLRGDQTNVGKLASHLPMDQESFQVTRDLDEMTGRPEMEGTRSSGSSPGSP